MNEPLKDHVTMLIDELENCKQILARGDSKATQHTENFVGHVKAEWESYREHVNSTPFTPEPPPKSK